MIQPTEDNIIVRKDEPRKQTASGIVLPDTQEPPDTSQKRAVWGTIVAAPERGRPEGRWEDRMIRALALGNRVLFSLQKAYEFEGEDGKPLYAVPEFNILAFEVGE